MVDEREMIQEHVAFRLDCVNLIERIRPRRESAGAPTTRQPAKRTSGRRTGVAGHRPSPALPPGCRPGASSRFRDQRQLAIIHQLPCAED